MTEQVEEEWQRYGRAIIGSMAEVLGEAHEQHHPVLLETADYWLSLGLAISLAHPEDGRRLLHLIETEEPSRAELETDARAFLKEVLG
ncbi:MAG TPA: hypothetical protein VG815_11605 [Chloroflexota bacterium]|jgi:hypothetical protein|nr:hypothetical protein [Chloroflexota bacterium]